MSNPNEMPRQADDSTPPLSAAPATDTLDRRVPRTREELEVLLKDAPSIGMSFKQALDAILGFVSPEQLGQSLQDVFEQALRVDTEKIGIVRVVKGWHVATSPSAVKWILGRDFTDILKEKASVQKKAVEFLGLYTLPASDTSPLQVHLRDLSIKYLGLKDIQSHSKPFVANFSRGIGGLIESLKNTSGDTNINLYSDVIKPTLLDAILNYTMGPGANLLAAFHDDIPELTAKLQDYLVSAAARTEIERLLPVPSLASKLLMELAGQTSSFDFLASGKLRRRSADLGFVVQRIHQQVNSVIDSYDDMGEIPVDHSFGYLAEHLSSDENMQNFRRLAAESGITDLPEDNNELRTEVMQQNAIAITLGGHETLASLVAHATTFMNEFPDVKNQIRVELKEFLKDQTFMDMEELLNFTFNTAHQKNKPISELVPTIGKLISETLRLLPPIMLIARYGEGLGNFLIPVGAIQRHYVKDGHKFDINRPESDYSKSNGYIPLGTGKRGCPGGPYIDSVGALLIILMSLFDFYNFEPLQDENGNIVQDQATASAIGKPKETHVTGRVRLNEEFYNAIFMNKAIEA